MVTYNELHDENHNITELSNVLLYLFKERTMCDTETCCELFHRYMDRVKHHIELVDKNLYSRLLTHDDHDIQKMARNFMAGSQEINRIMAAYTKQWCPRTATKSLSIKNHDEFLKETEEMFNLVLDRIQDETEKLYPLVKELAGDMKKAS